MTGKWIFGSTLVLVAGAVAAFAIYTFGWHTRSAGDSAKAKVDAQELAASLHVRLVGLQRVTDSIWRAVLASQGNPNVCYDIRTDSFSGVFGSFKGVEPAPCP